MLRSKGEPLVHQKKVDLGSDGNFYIPRNGIVLDEADFAFFASRMGADSGTVTLPNGVTRAFEVDASVPDEERLLFEVATPEEPEVDIEPTPAPATIVEEDPLPIVETVVEPAKPVKVRATPAWVSQVNEWVEASLSKGDGQFLHLRPCGITDRDGVHHQFWTERDGYTEKCKTLRHLGEYQKDGNPPPWQKTELYKYMYKNGHTLQVRETLSRSGFTFGK
jgi:hypothetical protein